MALRRSSVRSRSSPPPYAKASPGTPIFLVFQAKPFKLSDMILSTDDITPKDIYLNRRQILKTMGITAVTLSLPAQMAMAATTTDTPTTKESITTYNNFYEFGTDKSDPAVIAKNFKTNPWSIEISGLCENPGTLSLDAFLGETALEDRIYRLRCVEGWSMVIPWQGVPLSKVLEQFKPTTDAKYVAFETLYDPDQMPGQNRDVLKWPYTEGLRLDEAMHPLAFLATGLYGEKLANQNGAPIRLVVPWKYGFKSIKSITKITFTDTEPPTSWNLSAPSEYGFYSNVNPTVDHPRWSQKTERRIGEFFRRDTLMFNGYEADVAELYQGMNLQKHF